MAYTIQRIMDEELQKKGLKKNNFPQEVQDFLEALQYRLEFEFDQVRK